jgi:hypothetical protein
MKEGGAVNAGRLDQLCRDGTEARCQEERAEGERQRGVDEDDGQVVVDEIKPREEQIDRDEEDLTGYEEEGDDQREGTR